ncbi:MAG: carbohydrate ABC transporter permease [Chloroflexi bacterium]|nr:carbohydrate ABC transporter permease [Chloroflexota bacterium]
MTTAVAARRAPLRWRRILLYAVLVMAAGLYLVPVYVLLITGFKSQQEALNIFTMWTPPNVIGFHSFQVAWFGAPDSVGLEQGFWNSVQMVIPATLISSMIGSVNGYILSKWKFRGANLLFPLILFGMFIPYQSILIPLVQTYQLLERYTGIALYSTIAGLVVAHTIYGIPITTLIFRNYYAAIPNEMVEASRIDGANFFSIYRYILFPLSVPGFVVVMIWQFTSIWNDFLFGITLANTPKVYPITLSLNNIAGSFHVPWNIQMAAALLTAVPPLLVYIFLGRYFMRGLMAGSLKG